MLVWLLIGLGMAFVLVLARLSAGPVQLDWLAPRIEQALPPGDGTVAASVAGTELRLNRDARTLELVGIDVRYRSMEAGEPSSRPFLIFPEVTVRLSVEALLKKGVIAASEVVAEAPSLIISRSEEGVIGLFSEADQGGRNQDFDFGDFLRRFALLPEKDERFAFLKKLQIGGGRVAYYDHARASVLTAENADLMLARREDGVEGWLRAQVVQPTAGLASFQLSGRKAPGSDHIAFKADVTDLMPADLPGLWPLDVYPVPAELAGIRLPVRASIDGEIGLDGSPASLNVDLEGVTGVVDLPAYLAEPLDVDIVELEGRFGDDFDRFEIDQARIESRGAEVSGSGSIAWQEGDRALTLNLASRNVDVRDLPAFWSPRLGKKSRKWVLENVKAGLVSEAEVRLDLQPDDWERRPLRDQAVTGRFAFEGLSVRYVDEMPPLGGMSGSAVFDAERMEFDVVSGDNAGLKLEGGSVIISGMGKPGKQTTWLHVLADAEGSIKETLTLLDHPPLEVAKDLAIAPSSTSGRVNASLDVRLPLHAAVTAEEVVVTAEAELVDLTLDRLPKLDGDVRMDQGAFGFALDEETIRLKGTAKINDVPLAIEVFESREDQTSKRRIALAGDIGLDQLERQGISVDGLDGGFGFQATVTETGSHFWVDLAADLAGLAITPSGLLWQKPASQAGQLRASIAVPIEGAIEIRHFDVQTGDLQASGSLDLTPSNKGLKSLTLDAFKLGDTDAAMRLSPDGDGGYDVEVEARRLDLDALFDGDHEIDDTFQPFRAVMRTDQLRVRGIELVDVEADAAHAPDGWRSASVIGILPSGGKLALELVPDGDDRTLEIRSENAGALITALDLGRQVDGGGLSLTARIKSGEPTFAEGRFEIRSFVLKDAPLLARMLTLASFTGIDNLLGGEGIKVDHLLLPFTLDDRKLTFTDGLMRGSQLGLTLKGDVELEKETIDLAGTIIPVYSINRLLGQVPIIGRILTGADGRGAFAVTYSLKGPSRPARGLRQPALDPDARPAPRFLRPASERRLRTANHPRNG